MQHEPQICSTYYTVQNSWLQLALGLPVFPGRAADADVRAKKAGERMSRHGSPHWRLHLCVLGRAQSVEPQTLSLIEQAAAGQGYRRDRAESGAGGYQEHHQDLIFHREGW